MTLLQEFLSHPQRHHDSWHEQKLVVRREHGDNHQSRRQRETKQPLERGSLLTGAPVPPGKDEDHANQYYRGDSRPEGREKAVEQRIPTAGIAIVILHGPAEFSDPAGQQKLTGDDKNRHADHKTPEHALPLAPITQQP